MARPENEHALFGDTEMTGKIFWASLLPEPKPLDAIAEFLMNHFPEKLNNVSLWLDEQKRIVVVEELYPPGDDGSERCDIAHVIPVSKQEFHRLARAYKTRIQRYMDTLPSSY